jgi:hypothetical protein
MRFADRSTCFVFSLNLVPPAQTKTNKQKSHAGLLLRTLSEKESPTGITLKREFKVHGLGGSDGARQVEIREDIVRAGEHGPVMSENVATVSLIPHQP